MTEDKKPSGPDSDAEFVGWQKSTKGDAFALYNVTAPEHPLFQSTVSENTLRQQNLEVPPTPLQSEHNSEAPSMPLQIDK